MISKTLLTITARGNAIITELNRLYELVPAVFLASTPAAAATNQQMQYLLGGGGGTDQQSNKSSIDLQELICDFSYFKISDQFEAKIEASEELKRADENFCNNYIDILTRFYLTFESVQRYAYDLNNFVQEIDEDVHVGLSFDSLLGDVENRQLLCESYFLLGHMLLTIDNYFESSLREKIIVSYYRYSSYKSSPSSYLDETCNLMRSTGFINGGSQKTCSSKSISASTYHRPDKYPESFFSRVGVNATLVSSLVSKLLSVDIYNQTLLAFPHPDHRSTALGAQASMLYVILYFCPNILQTQRSKMREITDKFFYDNWVTSIYMGDLVNLVEAWNPYKAARESLVQLLDLESVRSLAEQYRARYERASRQLNDYLKEGWLDEDRMLEHHNRILTLIRESNVILRWFLLHSHTQSDWNSKLSKSLHGLVVEFRPSTEDLYMFLQNLAEIEGKYLIIYESLVEKRDVMISESRSRTIETLEELLTIFSDPKPMRYIQPGSHTKLVSHLGELVANIKATEFREKDPIVSMINQLAQLQEQYSDGKNLQVVQLFKETKDSLLQAMRSLSLSADIKIILHSISDFGYAWKILADLFRPQMQQIIKDNPLCVHGIGATFLKLASAFDASLIRIQQVDSKLDLMSVSKYYSSKLMSHVRDVLHVIPATILELLGSIIEIQTECVMGDLPSRINLDKLRDYALPEKRFQMLELTYKVSHYAESLMLLQDTVIGVIQVDSRRLLEDGIRRELVRRMSDSVHTTLTSSSSSPRHANPGELAESLTKRLTRLDELMSGFKRSLEYVQDYLFIYGLRMWQEELSRVVRFNVDIATSALQGKSQHQATGSSAQSADQQQQGGRIVVPVYDTNPLKSSFLVLILDELLRATDPRSTIYDDQMGAWYDQRSRDRVLDLKVFELIASSLGIVGLNGLDELCSCLLSFELQRLDESLASISQQQAHLLASLDALAYDTNKQQATRFYAHALRSMAPHSDSLANQLTSIGQLQLIRLSIGCTLSTKSRCEARNLFSCLETLNSSLLSALKSSSFGLARRRRRRRRSLNQHNFSNQQQQQQEATMRNNDYDEDDDDDDDYGMCASLATTGADELNCCEDEESQLLFELTNHLEWVGLSDPMSKIYTLSLQRQSQQLQQAAPIDMMFLLLLEHCSSKFLFAKSISSFLPKPSRQQSAAAAAAACDGAPFFAGLVTLLNHYDPFLGGGKQGGAPLDRLLNLMSAYVQLTMTGQAKLKPEDLTLASVNMILSLIELIRLARLPVRETLERTNLPQFVYDTFQFVVCQLDSQAN